MKPWLRWITLSVALGLARPGGATCSDAPSGVPALDLQEFGTLGLSAMVDARVRVLLKLQ